MAELLKLVGSWEEHDVVGVTTEAVLEPDAVGYLAPQLVLELPTRRCRRRGAPVVEVGRVSVRRVRDLPIEEWDVWPVVPRARV